MALLLANGSMSSNTNNEGEIRKTLVEQDIVECMVALPGQLFTNTQIPACIWFLTRDKGAKDGKRDRRGEVLFIDARNLGYMKDRVLRDFKDEDTGQIVDTFHDWQREWTDGNDKAGFCFSANLAAIRKHDFVLTPGRYVGAEAEEDDGIPFAEKMGALTSQLKVQFEKSDELESEIKKNLAGLGFEV
ncbi:MAG TPA: SAM-dependent DNA methyltransferase, partial [Methanosarcinaceae archaeon]|nr:SAM-dependent DNA methyltransferase [Methanosarcinaceae archaeon]